MKSIKFAAVTLFIVSATGCATQADLAKSRQDIANHVCTSKPAAFRTFKDDLANCPARSDAQFSLNDVSNKVAMNKGAR